MFQNRHYLIFQTRTIFTSSKNYKIVPKNLKGKSKSSQEWLVRQLNDPYVKKAQEMNYRARSAFKLLEIDEKIKILKPGQIVVECGAAPGAWSQVVVQKINSDGRDPKKPLGKLIGIDLLPIEPLPGAIFLPCCDFTSPETVAKIGKLLQNQETEAEDVNDNNDVAKTNPSQTLVDIILSDMAPNATGMNGVDHPRIISLVRQALQFAIDNGRVGSHFVTKIWDGHETPKLEKDLEILYHKVGRLKPAASRGDSAEVFLFGKGKRSS